MNYDLCHSCYAISGCSSRQFYKIDRTPLPGQGANPTVSISQQGSVMSRGVRKNLGVVILRVHSTLFKMAFVIEIGGGVS